MMNIFFKKKQMSNISLIPSISFSEQYFTIKLQQDLPANTPIITLGEENTTPIGYVKYSVNNGAWNLCNINNENLISINYNLSTGTEIQISIQLNYQSQDSSVSNQLKRHFNFSPDIYCDLKGNILSLIYGDEFKDNTIIWSQIFYRFFQDSRIQDARNLILPSTTLPYQCYANMFDSSSLTHAPNISTLDTITYFNQGCCLQMFANCTALQKPPYYLYGRVSEADNAGHEFESMFQNCSSLRYSPIIAVNNAHVETFAYTFMNCIYLSEITYLTDSINISNNNIEVDVWRVTNNWLSNAGTAQDPTEEQNPSIIRNIYISNNDNSYLKSRRKVDEARENEFSNNGLYTIEQYTGNIIAP